MSEALWQRCPNGHTSWRTTPGSVECETDHNYYCRLCGVRFDEVEQYESAVGADGHVMYRSMDDLRAEYQHE